MNKIASFIPNFLTLMNLASGSLAAIFAIDGDLGRAAIFIFIAAGFDFLDGLAARALKAYSDVGRELDSLADVVSFGVAPGMILLTIMEHALFGENIALHKAGATSSEWILLLAALLIPVFSAYRLAKFNIDTRQSVNFLGLPTPANAIFWASLGLMSGFSGNEELLQLLFRPGNLLVAVILTSLLLVSEIPMFSLKFSGFGFAENWYRYVFLAAAIILILLSWVFAPALIILLYISLSLSFYLLKVEI